MSDDRVTPAGREAPIETAILDKLEVAIDDHRHLPLERMGLRMAHIIVRECFRAAGFSGEVPASGAPQSIQPPSPSGEAVTEEAVSALRDAVALLDGQGCTNGSCVIERPTGMHTNGRCNCLRHRMEEEPRLRMAVGQVLLAARRLARRHSNGDTNG